jgi:hypothetical protein
MVNLQGMEPLSMDRKRGKSCFMADLVFVVPGRGIFALFALAVGGCVRLYGGSTMPIDYVIGGAWPCCCSATSFMPSSTRNGF